MKRKKRKANNVSESYIETITSTCDGFISDLSDDHENTFISVEKDGKKMYPFIKFITRNVHGFKESCTFLIPHNHSIVVDGERKTLKPLQ